MIYESLFTTKIQTTTIAFVLLMLSCTLVARPGFWWRSAALNYGPILAPAFLVSLIISDFSIPKIDLVFAIAFEFLILCMVVRFNFIAFGSLHQISDLSASRMIIFMSGLYMLAFLPSAFATGFGIFSEGTRIDYLYESSIAKYLTYLGLLVSMILGGLVARRITLRGTLGFRELAIILLVSGTSIVAGSKGGFILWLAAIVALVDFRTARIRPSTIFWSVFAFVGLVVVLVVIVSDFLGITHTDFLNLAFSRFYLNNDARALAFDLRTVRMDPGIDVLHETFRSISSVLGIPPRNAPLGVELYDRYFGPSGGAGANASLVAMIIFYSHPSTAAMPLVIASIFAGMVYGALQLGCRIMPSAFARFSMLSISSLVILLISQDLLAFQVVAPLVAIAALLFLLFGNLHVIALRLPRPIAP